MGYRKLTAQPAPHGSLESGAREGQECLSLPSSLLIPQVYITVLDENDNSPRFDFTSDSVVSVSEDCPVGQRVATVKARDPDAGSNGQVRTKSVWPNPQPKSSPQAWSFREATQSCGVTASLQP